MITDFAQRVMSAPPDHTYLFSVGQAGYIIKSRSGELLGIDLYLSNCVERTEGHDGFKRLLPKILGVNDLVFDGIIATHAHLDHFDMDSIPELMSNGHTRLCASASCSEFIKLLKMTEDRVNYVSPGDNLIIGSFDIRFVSCDHGVSAPDAVGVIVSVDSKRIYETGDTCLRLDKVSEYTQQGDIDVMIAPINGAYGNMNEKECAEFASAIKPHVVIPCHYGMFASHGGNPGAFRDAMLSKCGEINYRLMTQGEMYEV